MVEEHLDASVFDEIAEHGLGDVRLEMPLDVAAVLPSHALEELERIAADDLLSAVVRPAESAGDHAAQMRGRLEQRDA